MTAPPAAVAPPREVAANDADSLQANPGSPPTDETDLKHDTTILQREKATDNENEKIPELQPEPEPLRTRFTLDPAGENTHDETTVDVVAVPCPGGHPLRSWNRDGLMSRYFGAPSMRDAEVLDEVAGKPLPSWVRQGIRREADRARILLYEHPSVEDAPTLSKLADALLEDLHTLRTHEGQERPLVFVGHSVGGLVVKMALVKASREARHENVLRECYGVAFFGTPHQGSSYLAMPSLAPSIQGLLQLTLPLPPSITDELRVGNRLLAHFDTDFKAISDDICVWTFYETIDSRLSGGASRDVYFTAPLASIRSTILGMRQERIFPLQSDHANIASFGRHNIETLRLFTKQLAAQIQKAHSTWRAGDAGLRWTLSLEQKVNVEVHGFFDDNISPHSTEMAMRAWTTRLPLKDFLAKGPEACLSERLNEVEDGLPSEGRFLRNRGRSTRKDSVGRGAASMAASSPSPVGLTVANALGIRNTPNIMEVSPPVSPVLRPVDAAIHMNRIESAPVMRPGSEPFTPPLRPVGHPTRQSTPIRRASPLLRTDVDQDLVVDRLSPPIRGRAASRAVISSPSRSFSLGSDKSRYEYRDFPPFSQRSRSTFDGRAAGDGRYLPDDDEGLDSSPQLPESVVPLRRAVADGRRRVSENVIVDDEPAAFVKPLVKARKFVWIHLPYNDPTWVKSILQTLQVCYKQDYSSLYGPEFWATKHTKGRHSQHYAYYAKPGCYFTAPRAMSPRNHSIQSSPLSPQAAEEGLYTCLFLPYLHFDSYKKLIRRRDFILRRLAHGRARPVPEFAAKTDSLELQVVWEHLGHDPPINCRRTLDQYGYPSLRDTRSRDDDQMLYKLTKERVSLGGPPPDVFNSFTSYVGSDNSKAASGNTNGTGGTSSWRQQLAGKVRNLNLSDDESEEEEVLNGNVLMVDQLWLWALNSHTLLSFFPRRESDPFEGPLYQQADLRDSIFNEVNVDLTRQCDNALDLAALAALHAVSVLLDRSSHPDLEVFRIFEEAISALTEKLTSSLKEFRTEGVRDKAFDFDSVENKARSIRARHKQEGRRAERENRDNTSALLELRDIEDELLTLRHLFERQYKVISSMHVIYKRPELRDQTTNGRVFLNEAMKRLTEYIHQADEMISRARNTRDDYDKLLQMVQRQAQVDEVRLSRLHADLASAQSRSVMIFTTFTVIFLPLTFFTGLFGMNTHEWGGENNLSLKTIGAISLPASAVLVVASLVIAWSTNVRRFFRWLGRKYGRAERWAYLVLWRPVARMIVRGLVNRRRRRDADERDGSGAKSKMAVPREASDFWERHRLERDKGYQIPDVNKKIVGVGGGGGGGGGVRRARSGTRGKKEAKDERITTTRRR